MFRLWEKGKRENNEKQRERNKERDINKERERLLIKLY